MSDALVDAFWEAVDSVSLGLIAFCSMAILTVVLLAGCTAGQVDPAKVAAVDSQLQLACNTATALSPAAGPIAPYILAGCGTAEGLARLASDPAAVQWVNGLIAQVRAMRHG